MADRALAGSVMPVRKDQIILRTECSACGATMRNPSAACQHATKRGMGHFTRAEKAQNESLNPGLPPTLATTFGGRFPVPEHLVCSVTCLDRGDSRASTPCLCNCHYQGPTARRMIKEAGDAED